MNAWPNAPDSASTRKATAVRSEPVAIELAGVVRKPLGWLWPERIPLGKLTLLAGDPELGKSFITIDMAARVSSGRAWPDDPQTSAPLGNVILLNAEDDIEDTVCPRLEAAGADLNRCTALSAARSTADGLFHPISLGRDLAVLRALLAAKPECRLVVIDPISAYLGNVDGNSNTEVRSLLYPLAQLAGEFAVAVVAVTHLNKKGGGKAIYRTMGSLAFVAAVRSAWAVVRDPQDMDRHLLLHAKSNLQMKSPGLAYRFAAASREAIATIAWEADPITQTIDEVLASGSHVHLPLQEYRNGENYAATWLHETLADGPRPRSDIFSPLFRPDCISDPQVYRAAERLGVVKIKRNFSGNWTWCLPDHAERAQVEIAEERERKNGNKRKRRRRVGVRKERSGDDG